MDHERYPPEQMLTNAIPLFIQWNALPVLFWIHVNNDEPKIENITDGTINPRANASNANTILGPENTEIIVERYGMVQGLYDTF